MSFVKLFTGDNPVFSEMYVGCWSDVNDAYTRDMERLLNPSQQYWEGFTLGRCIAACHFLQYRYAAMQVQYIDMILCFPFPVWGANPKGVGANLLFWSFFPGNCMKLKKS